MALMSLSANFNSCDYFDWVPVDWLLFSLRIILSCFSVGLVIFDWKPGTVSCTFLGVGYSPVLINIFLINLFFIEG